MVELFVGVECSSHPIFLCKDSQQLEDCFFDAHEHLTYLRSLFRQQFYEKALNQANYMIKTFLMFNQEDEVKFILAMTNFHLYRYEKSIALFKDSLFFIPNILAIIKPTVPATR